MLRSGDDGIAGLVHDRIAALTQYVEDAALMAGTYANELLRSDEHRIVEQNAQVLRPLGVQPVDAKTEAKRARVFLNTTSAKIFIDDDEVTNQDEGFGANLASDTPNLGAMDEPPMLKNDPEDNDDKELEMRSEIKVSKL